MLLIWTTLRRLAIPLLVLLLFAPVARAWSWPVQGPVLEPFAYDEADPYAAGQHRGIDIGAGAAGDDVLAPAAGTVTFAGTVPTSGESVTIATPDGYSVTLTHLGSILIAADAAVAEGDVVGTVGPSGTPEVDGPYVHLGIRVTADPNGYLDPLSLLPPPAAEPPPAPAQQPAPSQPAASGTAAPATPTTPAPASEPAPSVPASTPAIAAPQTSTVAPHRRRASRSGRGRARPARPQAEPARPAGQPEARTEGRGAVASPHVAKLRTRPRKPMSSSKRPVVQVRAPVEGTGHGAATGSAPGHEPRPVGPFPESFARPGRQTPTALLPLVCNGGPAVVAVAAALAVAWRRRRHCAGTSPMTGAQVLQLPRPELEREPTRRAA